MTNEPQRWTRSLLRIASLLMMFFALIFPLLLNGQTFTNDLIGIVLAVGAIVATLAAENRIRPLQELGRSSQWIIAVAAILIAVLAVQLPANYRFQTEFNQQMKQIREGNWPPRKD